MTVSARAPPFGRGCDAQSESEPKPRSGDKAAQRYRVAQVRLVSLLSRIIGSISDRIQGGKNG